MYIWSYQVAVHFVKTTSKSLTTKARKENANIPSPCCFTWAAGFSVSMSYRADDVGDDFCAAIIMKLSSLPCLVSIVSFKHGTEKWKQRERKKKSTKFLQWNMVTKGGEGEERPFENYNLLFCNYNSRALFGENWNSCLSREFWVNPGSVFCCVLGCCWDGGSEIIHGERCHVGSSRKDTGCGITRAGFELPVIPFSRRPLGEAEYGSLKDALLPWNPWRCHLPWQKWLGRCGSMKNFAMERLYWIIHLAQSHRQEIGRRR